MKRKPHRKTLPKPANPHSGHAAAHPAVERRTRTPGSGGRRGPRPGAKR